MLRDRVLIEVVSVYSGLHDYESVKSYLSEFEKVISTSGLADYYLGARSSPGEHLRARNAVVFVVTGGTSSLAFGMLRDVERVYIVYHEEHNSLTSALNLGAMLRDSGKRYKLISLSEFPTLAPKLGLAVRALSRVAGTRVLVFGDLPKWSELKGHVHALRSQLGVELEVIGLSDVYKKLPYISSKDVEDKAREILEQAESIRVDFGDYLRSVSLYLALRREAESRRVENVAVKCFDLIKDLGCAGCVAVAELIRDGVIAGCEADVQATVVMRVLRELSGKDPWMGNISGLWNEGFELSHCTISRSIVKSYRLVTHFESGKATSIEGVVEEGSPATVVAYDPARALWRVIEAEVVRGSPWSAKKCRTQVKLRASREAVREIKENPIEGHYVMVLASVAEEAAIAGELGGLNVQLFRLQS